MRIIIAGAGEVGSHLAHLLSSQMQEITLIDLDNDKLKTMSNKSDITTINGDATSIELLKELDINKIDMFIAVTASDSANFTAAVLAKKWGAKKTLARLGNPEYLKEDVKKELQVLGIDEVISPEALAAREIVNLISFPNYNQAYRFDNGELQLLGKALKAEAPIVNLTIQETVQNFPDVPFITILIQRKKNKKTIIPRGNTKFQAGDQVYFITTQEGVQHLQQLTGEAHTKIKTIAIVGGGMLGKKTAKLLNQEGYYVKLFEKDKRKADQLTNELGSKTMVINGDGRDTQLLKDEVSASSDALIALTGNSEANIMSCLFANTEGIKKTIALVENTGYLLLSQDIGVDSLVNKKFLAASKIVRYIRKGDVLAIANVKNTKAEVLEFEVHFDSKIIGKRLSDISLPRNSVIGGVMRNHKGYLPNGDFQIQDRDHVIVFCLPEAISSIEDLF
ncbi:MAG: Trk system potassium transporter TrkA [Flavobacteriales bacterium]